MVMAMTGNDTGSGPIAELNTTPLIDVMLVLLVMFIIIIPVQTHAVKIDLPNMDGVIISDPVINRVTIDAQNQVLWNDRSIDLVTLAKALDQTKAMTPMPELHVRPDAQARYEIANRVMAVIKRSEVGKMGFVGNEEHALFTKD
jgi:biopolymer transport protein ExbD